MTISSIRDIVERTSANAKALECLGKAGAFNNLEDGLNELEAAEYGREMVVYLRDLGKFKERSAKHAESLHQKEEKFRDKVEARRVRMEEKDAKYQKKLTEYEARLAEVQVKNAARGDKKPLKEPVKPLPPKPLKGVEYPKPSKVPTEPPEPPRPRIALSQRERVRLQREMLYIYLTGHPLDEALPENGLTPIGDLALLVSPDGEEVPKKKRKKIVVTIRGVLLSHKVTNTRSKKLMARLRLEDKTGSIEVVVFPALYDSLKGLLTDGEIYKVTGEVDTTKNVGDDGEERSHTQVKGKKVRAVRIGSDKEWDINYPLLRGGLRILPGPAQKSKGLAASTIMQQARKTIEARIEALRQSSTLL